MTGGVARKSLKTQLHSWHSFTANSTHHHRQHPAQIQATAYHIKARGIIPHHWRTRLKYMTLGLNVSMHKYTSWTHDQTVNKACIYLKMNKLKTQLFRWRQQRYIINKTSAAKQFPNSEGKHSSIKAANQALMQSRRVHITRAINHHRNHQVHHTSHQSPSPGASHETSITTAITASRL